MNPFDYVSPSHLPEACEAMALHGTDALLLSGGTDLNVALRHGHLTTPCVIDLKKVQELKPSIDRDGGGLRISAQTTMTALGKYLTDHALFPSLRDAAAVVGSIQIRNRATLVGNICNASPAADTVPVLSAMGAEVEIYTADGTRTRLVEHFIEGNRKIDLGPGEIVTAVRIPLPDHPRGCAFDRITRRRGVDLATCNIAVTVSPDEVVVAFGAVTPRPLVLRDQSGVLTSSDASAEDRAKVIDALASQAAPITDVRASADYRTAMLSVIGERALELAHKRLAKALADV
ncbi:MAG: xanthine dehydrogenase family protein subunit M [Pseudomonadota bacterium]